MADPDFEIASANLPDGFAEQIEQVPDEPVPARAAATIVLARTGEAGLEVLLVRRNRSSGFVPGAWVFPGGRVDGTDASPSLLDRVDRLDPARVSERLGLSEQAEPPAISYVLAAIREAFEETGLLVARTSDGSWPEAAAHDAYVDGLREAVLEDRTPFAEALRELDCRIDGDSIEYLAHWITPLVEPRRYDTRFFLAEVSPTAKATLDPREMIDARWRKPADALAENAAGDLPMVFPTIRTLEQLEGFSSVPEAIEYFRGRAVPPILPRLVRTPTGVGIEIPETHDE